MATRTKSITQHQAIFYQLFEKRAVDPDQFTPIWQLIGEVYCKELALWGFVSYEVSARMSEMFKENPLLFERKIVTGKTGAEYYAYRIRKGVQVTDIVNEKLLAFYKKVKTAK